MVRLLGSGQIEAKFDGRKGSRLTPTFAASAIGWMIFVAAVKKKINHNTMPCLVLYTIFHQ